MAFAWGRFLEKGLKGKKQGGGQVGKKRFGRGGGGHKGEVVGRCRTWGSNGFG